MSWNPPYTHPQPGERGVRLNWLMTSVGHPLSTVERQASGLELMKR
jgi:hypothetical protein